MCKKTLKQNTAVDLYEAYFTGGVEGGDLSGDPPTARSLTVFKDPTNARRTAAYISWHPEGGKKLAIAYACLRFQQMPEGYPTSSYIWDINNPNLPEFELKPSSQLCCLEFNTRDAHVLLGGCYNGIVELYDDRVGELAVGASLIEKSHRDPIYDVAWLQSKTCTEAITTATDGQVLRWDSRKLTDPAEIMSLEVKGGENYGGVSLNYDVGAGAKILVGTEQGDVLCINRKAKNPQDRISAPYTGHVGAVHACERNPFSLRYFLTVGDWTARLWTDELRTPIVTTRYHKTYLTDAAWSPTRPSVFFITKHDGSLDIWDYLYKQNDPLLTLQISDAGVHCLAVQQKGTLLVLGGVDGSATLLEVSESLTVHNSNEKASFLQILDREFKRERNLERGQMLRKRDAFRNRNVDFVAPEADEKVFNKIERDFKAASETPTLSAAQQNEMARGDPYQGTELEGKGSKSKASAGAGAAVVTSEPEVAAEPEEASEQAFEEVVDG